MRIRFDQGPKGPGTCFATPQRLIRADQPHQVPAALKDLDAARAAGKWLAGYASYELGYALEPKLAELMPTGRRLPLMCFGVYDAPLQSGLIETRAAVQRLTPRWDFSRYATAFAQVKQDIGAGNIYQANLTFPLDATVRGDSDALYAALMYVQPVGYGALVEQGDLPDLLSRSPELFFRTKAGGMIETRPMKGTQPRSDDPVEDAARRDFLQRDEKNRAENLMIVDLLRHKTTRREIFDRARAALPKGIDEAVFLNERDEVCEGTITNIVIITAEGEQLTPPLTSGCLPGVYRQSRLNMGGLREAVLTLADLQQAHSIYLVNALRGATQAIWAPQCSQFAQFA